jgi:16S rRNA (guanine527-N7)-methyltransferase
VTEEESGLPDSDQAPGDTQSIPAAGTAMTELGSPTPQALALFGNRIDLAIRYAELLAGAGIERGLIGPRELDRLWDRHLVNCALVTPLFPVGATVVDLGSGAGLPGLVLACMRPDLTLILLDAQNRRVTFLREAIESLELADRVRAVWGRAEDLPVRRYIGKQAWVISRAVAPLDRLAGWCSPLLQAGGSMLAMKGEQAEAEVEAARGALRRMKFSVDRIAEFGTTDVTRARVVICKREGR